MRLLSYRIGDQDCYGVATDGGIVDLTRRIGEKFPTLLSLIQAGVREVVRDARPDHAFSDVMFLPPVTLPENIWCVGVNYQDRNAEYRDNAAAAQYPSLFCRSPHSFVGHDQPIERPRVSQQLDYEGEIALIIGRTGHHVARERAHDHIFGLTLCNEGTVRDWTRHGKFNVTQGKNFDRSGSLGPWIVTADEINWQKPLTLTTRVNGEVRQQDSTDRLLFPFDRLIEYLTTFATLRPGDVIVTGTPTGAGARFDPPRWLKPGDVVEVEASGIGILRNSVVDESAH